VTITEFEESILKDSLIAKVKKVRSDYTTTSRLKRQITKVKVLTTKDANSRIAIRTEKENQQWVRRVRRETAKKLAEEKRLAELRKMALAGNDVDRLFEPFDIFRINTEGDSSLRV
jgi:N-acetylmuramoyl-L-alanine amidase CwlA